ncbi:unnamed protein product, partial [Rotaria sp. Silwood1]
MRTTDSGNNWIRVGGVGEAFFTDIGFLNQFTGIALGGSCIRTTNGGLNWINGIVVGQSVSSFGENRAMVCSYNGSIVKSTDIGQTWFTVLSGGDFYGIKFIDSNTVVASGGLGKIMKTTNGGTSWFAQQMGNSVSGSTYAIPYDADIVVYKYNSAGTQQWVVTYGGAVSTQDSVVKAVMDANGNIYITGCTTINNTDSTEILTMMVSTAGIIVWTKTYHIASGSYQDIGNDVFVDAGVDNGFNVFVTGFYGTKTLTAKYNSSGVKQWGVSYVSSVGNAVAKSIVIDNAGNPIIAGSNDNGGTGKDFLIVKLTSYIYLSTNDDGVPIGYGIIEKINSSGTVVWSYIDTSYSNVRYNDLDFDVSGNIYITGTANANCITMKFSSAGAIVWSRSFNGSGSGYDGGISIALDAGGNIYLCGNSFKNATNYIDMIALKYNSAGTFQWSQYLPATSSQYYDRAVKIKIDAANNIIVGGNLNIGILQDVQIVIYNPAGTLQTSYVIGGTAGDDDLLTDMILDASGNIYVTGSLRQNGTGNDLFVEKISSGGAAGSAQWISTYNAGGASTERGLSLTTDKNGNVFVGGYVIANSVYEDILTVKFNSNGLFQWAKTIVNPAQQINYANSVTADTNGNIFMTG